MALTPSPKPNGRLGSRKSKTGCLTCKARRVRCGEERPFCRRCIVAGFRCRGYQDPFMPAQTSARAPAKQQSTLVMLPPPITPSPIDARPEEIRSFEMCRTELIPHLGGALEFGFWQSLVLQISQSEPAVHQSVVALGSMFEQSRASQFRSSELNPTTLKAYNNALAVTSRRTEAPDSELVALVTCVLFLCIEFMQGNKQRALGLLKHGQTILRKHLQERSSSSVTSRSDHLSDTIIPLYERLAALSSLFGQLLPPLHSSPPVLTATASLPLSAVSSFGEARNILYLLCLEGNKFIKKTKGIEDNAPEHQSSEGDPWDLGTDETSTGTDRATNTLAAEESHALWRLEQAALLGALDKWLSMLRAYSQAHFPVSVREQQQERILLMWHATATARVKSALQLSESCYNDYLSHFATIVEHAERFQEVAANHPGVSEFTFEMGVLPPLFFTALKCRNHLRLRAIAAMRKAPRKEGLWDREELLAVSKKVVDLEHSESVIAPGTMACVDPKVRDVKISRSLSSHDNVCVILLLIADAPEAGWQVSEALLQLHEDL